MKLADLSSTACLDELENLSLLDEVILSRNRLKYKNTRKYKISANPTDLAEKKFGFWEVTVSFSRQGKPFFSSKPVVTLTLLGAYLEPPRRLEDPNEGALLTVVAVVNLWKLDWPSRSGPSTLLEEVDVRLL